MLKCVCLLLLTFVFSHAQNHDVDTAYHLKLSESIKTLQDVIGTQDVRTPSPAPSAEAPPTPSPEKHFTTDPASGEKQ